MMITAQYLREHPNEFFVYGDNLLHKGLGGAAKLRNEFNTIGFITKKYPNNNDSSFYRPKEYKFIYDAEIIRLIQIIRTTSNCTFLISKLGAGLANRYNIFEKVIEPTIKEHLAQFTNVKFLW